MWKHLNINLSSFERKKMSFCFNVYVAAADIAPAPNLFIIEETDESLKRNKVKLAIFIEGDPKATFSIATTPRCRGGHYSSLWIAPLYP